MQPDTETRTHAPAAPRERPDEYRGVVVCIVLAVMAILIAVIAVIADEAWLALGAAVAGVAAAAVGSTIDVHRARAERSLLEARAETRHLRRDVQSLRVRAQADSDGAPDVVGNTDEWEIDPATGLLRERHLPVLLSQVVAAGRRKVLPVSVVYWELDGLDGATDQARDQAVTALGAVAWRTLRESDAMFRVGDTAAVAVLVDTAEPGALIVAERVRDALRASPIGDSLTTSAGIACYPSHALDAAELVSRAGRALEAARADGHARDHIEVASVD